MTSTTSRIRRKAFRLCQSSLHKDYDITTDLCQLSTIRPRCRNPSTRTNSNASIALNSTASTEFRSIARLITHVDGGANSHIINWKETYFWYHKCASQVTMATGGKSTADGYGCLASSCDFPIAPRSTLSTLFT